MTDDQTGLVAKAAAGVRAHEFIQLAEHLLAGAGP